MWREITKQECGHYLLYSCIYFLHSGTLKHASKADNHWGLGVFLQNQATSTGGRDKQRKLQSGLWRDASESFTATGPKKSHPTSSSSQTAFANTQFQHQVNLWLVVWNTAVNVHPKYSHLMYVFLHFQRALCCSSLILNKWGTGPERVNIQGPYQTSSKLKKHK